MINLIAIFKKNCCILFIKQLHFSAGKSKIIHEVTPESTNNSDSKNEKVPASQNFKYLLQLKDNSICNIFVKSIPGRKKPIFKAKNKQYPRNNTINTKHNRKICKYWRMY